MTDRCGRGRPAFSNGWEASYNPHQTDVIWEYFQGVANKWAVYPMFNVRCIIDNCVH